MRAVLAWQEMSPHSWEKARGGEGVAHQSRRCWMEGPSDLLVGETRLLYVDGVPAHLRVLEGPAESHDTNVII